MVFAALMMALSVPFAASAYAQDSQLPYPGPLRGDNGPGEGEGQSAESDGLGTAFVAVDAQPGDGDTTTVGGTGGGSTLAATGSDVEPILAMSIGLLAAGGSILVTSRRRMSDELV